MQQNLEDHFSAVQKKVVVLQKNFQTLYDDHEELTRQHIQLKERLEEERKKNQELAETQKTMKLYAAIAGNPDHNRLMKNHINRLVKEIDTCIAQLQSHGL